MTNMIEYMLNLQKKLPSHGKNKLVRLDITLPRIINSVVELS